VTKKVVVALFPFWLLADMLARLFDVTGTSLPQ